MKKEEVAALLRAKKNEYTEKGYISSSEMTSERIRHAETSIRQDDESSILRCLTKLKDALLRSDNPNYVMVGERLSRMIMKKSPSYTETADINLRVYNHLINPEHKGSLVTLKREIEKIQKKAIKAKKVNYGFLNKTKRLFKFLFSQDTYYSSFETLYKKKFRDSRVDELSPSEITDFLDEFFPPDIYQLINGTSKPKKY